MKWLITKDFINSNCLHTCGGSTTVQRAFKIAYAINADHAVGIFSSDMTHELQLYDDDGTLYYEALAKDLDKAPAEEAFAPQDFAANEAGVTTTMYRKIGEQEWKQL